MLTLLVMAMWAGSLLLVAYAIPEWSDRGSFGDMFGAVGALFSGLAFVGLIVTIYVQLEQLDLHSDQLREAREELKRQKEELAAQHETLRKQRFEDTFFQLLRLHSDIVNTMDIDIRQGGTRRGRDCFVVMYNELYREFSQANPPGEAGDGLGAINQIFQEFYHKHQADLGHYFTNLSSIVKFVNSNEIPDKNFYVNLLASELSSHELLLLFYYGLSDSGSQSFKPLIEQYDMLQNIPKNNLLVAQHSVFYESLKVVPREGASP